MDIFKYAIPINKNTLELVASINGGVKPKLEDKPTYYIFDAIEPTTCRHSDIITEDELYDDIHVGKGEVIRFLT